VVEVPKLPWRRPGGWWLRNRRYMLFQLREVGGVLSAVYGVLLLVLLSQYQAGPDAYASFLAWMRSPPVLVPTAILFAFVLVHALSWFVLIGKTQAVMSAGRAPPPRTVIGLMVGLFAVVSIAVVYLVFGGP